MGIVTKNPLFLRIDREIHAIRAEVQLLNRAQSYLSTQKADTSGLYPVVLAGAASTIEKYTQEWKDV